MSDAARTATIRRILWRATIEAVATGADEEVMAMLALVAREAMNLSVGIMCYLGVLESGVSRLDFASSLGISPEALERQTEEMQRQIAASRLKWAHPENQP